MPEIRIYADKLASEPAEVHHVAPGMTVEQWLHGAVPSYRNMPEPPISIALDGELLTPKQWGERVMDDGAVVEVVVEPGADMGVGEIIMLVISLISTAYTIYMLNNLPDAPTRESGVGKGSSIYDPNAQGNRPRIMLPVPEIFGRHPVFPDYICQPRRVFINDETWLLVNLCVGRGTYTLNELYIGNTPVSSYADDVIYQLKGPGESVSAHEAHLNIYTSPEVGSTYGAGGFEAHSELYVPGVTTVVSTYVHTGEKAVFSGSTLYFLIRYLRSEILYKAPWYFGSGSHIAITGATAASATFAGNVNFVDGATISQTTYAGSVDIVDNGNDGGTPPVYYADSIISRSGSGLGVFAVDDQVTVSGAGANDGTYYVNTVTASAITLKDALGDPVTNLSPMTAITITITLPGDPSTTDEIRSVSGSGLDVLAVDSEITLSGAGARDGTYYVRTSSPGAITLKDSGGTPLTGMEPGSGIYVTMASYAINDGTYRIDSIASDVASLTKVDPVTLNPIVGWGGFSSMSIGGVSATLVESEQNLMWIGPYFAIPQGETTTRIWLSFIFRRGLAYIDGYGNTTPRTIHIDIQYRNEGDVAWTSVSWSRTESTLDQLGSTVEISLPYAMRPEVRVRRVTITINDAAYRDDIEWVALQGELATPTSYAGITTLQLKVRGTNSLASSAESKIKADVTRHLPSYTGGAWQAAAPTESIADAALYVLKDAGYTDDQIDLAEFQRLRGVWAARGDTFSGVFDNATTLYDALRGVLATGYAEPTIDWGMVMPVRDEPRTAWDHVYTPDVMTGKGVERDVVLWDPNEPDGIEVEYFDRATAKPATVTCLLAGDAGVRPEKIKAFGITDPVRAWRLGMRRRRTLRYMNTKLTWSTELAALNSSYLSYCAVADGIPGQAQSGRVAAASGVRITCDRDLEWGAGVHYMALRAPDGSLLGPYTATAVTGDARSVDLDTNPGTLYPESDTTYQIPTLWTFGPATDWCIPALVKSIKPKGENEVQVEAALYDARVYADDDNSPP